MPDLEGLRRSLEGWKAQGYPVSEEARKLAPQLIKQGQQSQTRLIFGMTLVTAPADTHNPGSEDPHAA